MPKRTVFSKITPLPSQVSREVAVALLHDHDEMIELNPVIIEHHPIKTPKDAPADEFLDCAWQELTEKVHYFPGGLVKGKVSYKACFHDTPTGLQAHIYAPLGLDIREKWTIGGTLPGEPPEARELGVKTPKVGLYLREDCDMSCNAVIASRMKKNLVAAHKVLVERILKKAEMIEEHLQTCTTASGALPATSSPFQPGSHMSKSRFSTVPSLPVTPPLTTSETTTPTDSPVTTPGASPQSDFSPRFDEVHPAFRPRPISRSNSMRSGSFALPSYQLINPYQTGYLPDKMTPPLYVYQGGRPVMSRNQYPVELPAPILEDEVVEYAPVEYTPIENLSAFTLNAYLKNLPNPQFSIYAPSDDGSHYSEEEDTRDRLPTASEYARSINEMDMFSRQGEPTPTVRKRASVSTIKRRSSMLRVKRTSSINSRASKGESISEGFARMTAAWAKGGGVMAF